MNKLISLIFIFCFLALSNAYSTIRVCWKATGQCKIISGETSCNGWGFNGGADCSVLKTSGTSGGSVQCYRTSSGKAYLNINGISTEIASDDFINNARNGKLDPTWKKYENQSSSQKVIDQLCKEYNIKVISKEISQTIGK